MSNFLIFGVFQMIFTQKVLNVIKAGFHRSWFICFFFTCTDSKVVYVLFSLAASLNPFTLSFELRVVYTFSQDG